MGKSGPPKKPTAIKELTGNPGRRKLPQGEPKPITTSLECPEHLQGEARAEWFRIIGGLNTMKLYTDVDRSALAAYCSCWADYVHADKMSREASMVDDGNVSAYFNAKDKALKHLRMYLREFGFTPASRAGIVVASDDAKDEFSEWKNKRGGKK